MRWKLLVITSLVATIVGSGAALGIIYLLFGYGERPAAPGWLGAGALLIPLAAIIFASVFVYRRTARRRKLQAFMTALITLTLTLSVFIVCARFFTKPRPGPEPPAPVRNVG